jgi:hypothetical protein
MKQHEIRAQIGKDEGSPSVTATYNMPENLAEAGSVWTDAVVFSKARQSVVIDLQALMRRLIAKQTSPGDIQTAVNAYIPTAAGEVVRRTAEERVKEDIVRLSPEAKAALIKQLQEQLRGASKTA